MPPARRPSRTESSRSSNCSPWVSPLDLPWVLSSRPCSIKMESRAAMGPGPATTWPCASGGVPTLKPPLAAEGVLRLMADVSTRPEPLKSTGLSHCDTPASLNIDKERLGRARPTQYAPQTAVIRLEWNGRVTFGEG